jgi:hypothetical protein
VSDVAVLNMIFLSPTTHIFTKKVRKIFGNVLGPEKPTYPLTLKDAI